jgi:hypothetical protein
VANGRRGDGAGGREADVDDIAKRVADLLHEAAETHHIVFRITDGTDPDWASWYSDWLTTLSELPQLLGRSLVRSELTYQLVRLDREFTSEARTERWEEHYARELASLFSE